MWSSVDLPQPDGPRTAMWSPGVMSSDTSWTAVTGPAGIVNRRLTCDAEMIKPAPLMPALSREHLGAERRGNRQARHDLHRVQGGRQRRQRQQPGMQAERGRFQHEEIHLARNAGHRLEDA